MNKNARLLIIAPHYTTFIKDQVEALSSFYMQINIIILHNPLSEPFKYISGLKYFKDISIVSKKNIIDNDGTPDNINIHIFSSLFYTPINIITKFNLYKNTDMLAKQIINYVRSNDIEFDIIHSHFIYPAGSIGISLKKYYHKPLVITGHGYDVYSLPFRSPKWRVIVQKVLNGADHIITVSLQNMKCLKELDVTPPISVIPNGFVSDLFHSIDKTECRTIHQLPLDTKIIMTVCNLDPIKGLDNLIKAVQYITLKRKDVICVIIGSGVGRSTLKKLTTKLELDKYIQFISKQPHSTIPKWIGACDLFVLPSLNEGNPTVMFEALGCGKPFVGTKVGGVPEVIISDEYGLLVEPANPESLAESILISLDREWDHKLILNHASQYTWNKITMQIISVHEQVLKEDS